MGKDSVYLRLIEYHDGVVSVCLGNNGKIARVAYKAGEPYFFCNELNRRLKINGLVKQLFHISEDIYGFLTLNNIFILDTMNMDLIGDFPIRGSHVVSTNNFIIISHDEEQFFRYDVDDPITIISLSSNNIVEIPKGLRNNFEKFKMVEFESSIKLNSVCLFVDVDNSALWKFTEYESLKSEYYKFDPLDEDFAHLVIINGIECLISSDLLNAYFLKDGIKESIICDNSVLEEYKKTPTSIRRPVFIDNNLIYIQLSDKIAMCEIKY